MRARTATILVCTSVVCGTAAIAASDEWEEEEFSPPTFRITGNAIGGVKPAPANPGWLSGSRIAALEDGGAIVIDADSGALIRTDGSGARRDQLAIGANAGLLVYDPIDRRAYVADRSSDRIVVVGIGDELRVVGTWKTPAEPYGVALAPDRHTLLATTIADRTLVALDVRTAGTPRWRMTLDAEPRGVAIAPDGARAVVSSLTSGALAQVSLTERKLARRLPLLRTLHAGASARGAFAVAFVGDTSVTAFQLDVPVATDSRESSGDHYGGSFLPPITHNLAWSRADGEQALAETNVGEPRALAWDGAHDVLYVAGLATDEVVAVKNASQIDVGEATTARLDQRCGADGLAIGSDGGVFVWCSFTRRVVHFAAPKKPGMLAKKTTGPELVASTLDATHHAGMVLFHTASSDISGFGAMSCGNCHLDGRADGLSWQIGKGALQTPVLGGRIAGTAPYKWDGKAADLPHSLAATVNRLGGTGLSKKDLAALTAFVETMPAVRAPTRNASAVARGKALFESAELGCASCHEGSAYTDRDQHAFGSKTAFDTPGLAALAASAPYFHDGSAATLEEVVRDRGKVHGMADDAKALTPSQAADLVAFLESL